MPVQKMKDAPMESIHRGVIFWREGGDLNYDEIYQEGGSLKMHDVHVLAARVE